MANSRRNLSDTKDEQKPNGFSFFSDVENTVYRLGDQALQAASDLYKNSAARRTIKGVLTPFDIYNQFTKVVDNYDQNIKEGHSTAAAISGAASAWAVETGTASAGDFLIGSGVATLDPAAIALGTGLAFEAKQFGEKANVTTARLVDSGINKMSVMYRHAMVFITECAGKLLASPTIQYSNIELAMLSLGYHDHTKSFYSELDANQRYIYNAVARDLFDEHFKLNDSQQLFCIKKPIGVEFHPAVLKPTIAGIKSDLNKIKASAGEILKTKQTKLNQKFPTLINASQSTIRHMSDQKISDHTSSISQSAKTQIKSMADQSYLIGKMFSDVAYGAILAGGHPRTWEGVGQVGSNLVGLSQNLMLIQGASSYTSLAAFTGYIGVAVAGLSLVMNMMGSNSGSDGLQTIYDAIQALHQAMLNGFKNLEKLINQNMAVVISRLTKIVDDLNRIENILSVSFKELHLKELEDVVDKLKKEMDGEITLSDIQKKECLIQLSSWIDIHSKSKIQTSVLRDSKDVSKPVAILGEKSFDMMAMFPYLMVQLSHVLPPSLLQNLNINDLPNLAVLTTACDALVTAQNKYQLDDHFGPTLSRANQQFIRVKQIIEKIIKNEETWDILFRQYDAIRYLVGRAIFKCRQEFSARSGIALRDHLKIGINTENLMQLLDQLELRRLLLINLCKLSELSAHHQNNVFQLESKEDILSRHAENYDKQANGILTFSCQINYPEFKKSLEYGANVNQWDSWGQSIHYIGREGGKNHKASIQLMHQLFKSGKELDSCNSECSFHVERRRHGTISVYGTWGISVVPITWLMNSGYFHLGLIYCAAGNDIILDNPHFMNGITWSTKSNWSHYIQYYLVADMNSESGFLNKKDLQKAYQFYKDIESGLCPSIDNINHNCVLWLVCVLGDLKPLQALGELKADINKSLPSSGFTPLMMAVNCNHENVIEYLLKQGANIHAKGEFISSKDDNPSHMMSIALRRKNWQVANLLASKGITISEKEHDEIQKGLQQENKAITQVGSSSIRVDKTNVLSIINDEILRLNATIESLKLTEELNSQAEQKNVPNNELVECFNQCKKIRTLLPIFVKKINPEQGNTLSDINEQLKVVDELVKQIDMTHQDTNKILPLMKKMSTSLNMIDMLLKAELENVYTLSNNVDRILEQLNNAIKKTELNVSKKSAHITNSFLGRMPRSQETTSSSNKNEMKFP